MNQKMLSHSNGKAVTDSSVHVRAVLGFLIESGLLYLVAQLLVVIFFATGSNAQAIIVPAALQIYVCIIYLSADSF